MIGDWVAQSGLASQVGLNLGLDPGADPGSKLRWGLEIDPGYSFQDLTQEDAKITLE